MDKLHPALQSQLGDCRLNPLHIWCRPAHCNKRNLAWELLQRPYRCYKILSLLYCAYAQYIFWRKAVFGPYQFNIALRRNLIEESVAALIYYLYLGWIRAKVMDYIICSCPANCHNLICAFAGCGKLLSIYPAVYRLVELRKTHKDGIVHSNHPLGRDGTKGQLPA